MADLATLQAEREALRKARNAGVKTAEVDGRRVEYKSDQEMRQALSDLDWQIAAAQGGRPLFGVVRIISSKGM